jgi:hypothetical protein
MFSLRDKKATPIVDGSVQAGWSVFSPDDRWLAYRVADAASESFYVQPFPPTGAKYQSPRDGDSPV